MKIGKRVLSLIMSVIMVLTLGMTSYADEIPETQLSSELTYKVIVNQPENGTLTLVDQNAEADGTYQIAAGQGVAIQVTANEGYQIENVTMSTADETRDLEVTEGNATFQMPESDCELSAVFSEQKLVAEDVKDEVEESPENPEENPDVSEEQKEEVTPEGEENTDENYSAEIEKRRADIKSTYFYSRGRAARISVDLDVGRRISYDGYSTNYFTVEGNTAYCLEPAVPTPSSGRYSAKVLSNNSDLARALWYVVDGPGAEELYAWYGSEGYWQVTDPWINGVRPYDERYSYSHMFLSWIYADFDWDTAFYGTTIPDQPWYDLLKADYKNKLGDIRRMDAPPSGFSAYVIDTGSGTQVMGGWSYVPSGFAQIEKSSANPDLTDGNSCYSLAGAEYGVYTDAACKNKVGTLTTKANGTSNKLELETGKYYIKETKAPKGFALDSKVYTVTITSNNTSTVKVKDLPQSDPVAILLGKIDRETTQNMPQGSASLENAEFTVKYYSGFYNSDPAESGTKAVRTWVFKTNANGFVRFDESAKVSGDDFYYMSNGDVTLPLGTITIQETKAPTGYLLNDEVFVRQITSEGTAEGVNTYNEPEIPENIIKGGVHIEKWDHETGQNKPQGGATLEGAEIQIITDNDNPVTVNGKSYSKGEVVTTIVTNKDGVAATGADTLPYGDYIAKEVKQPEGYLLLGELERRFTIRENGVMVNLNTAGTAIRDNIIRGDIQIVKFAEPTDEEEDQMPPLEGIIFEITSKTTGQSWEITTDENGYANTKQLGISDRGNLVYDTYIVHEKNTPDGLTPVDDFEVTVDQEGKTYYYILEDKQIVSPVQLVKVDSTTGKVIPIANTEFQLLDEDKNVITMTTHYPSTVVHETFKTDESGTLTLPDKLPYGIYYFRELNAPEGYLKGEDLRFEITENHNWEDPLVVRYADEPAMGLINIVKTDKETGEALKGAEFTITAAEDIVTPDGTTRAVKGEVVDTITTDKDGIAQSKRLFLGKYTVKETKQPTGYVRPDQEWDVELVYKDQETEIVTETLNIENTPTTLIIDKKVTGSDERLSGVKIAVWNKAMEDDVDPGIMQKEIYTTGKDGTITMKRLAPGTYRIQEVQGIPGYAVDDTIHEITIAEDGTIEGGDTGTVVIENAETEIVETNAISVDTNSQQAIAKADTIIKDTVTINNLQVGEEYTLKGILMDTLTGVPMTMPLHSLIGEEVTAEKTFIAEESTMDIEMEFLFDSSDWGGHTITVFERLYQQGEEISVHTDLKDEKQRVEFPMHEIHTTANDQDTEGHQGIAKEKTTIVDTVEYSGLIPGQEYTLKGVLMRKDTGKPLEIDGKEVTAEKTFVPEKPEGTVDIEFTFDSSELEGNAVVVFERLYVQGIEVAAHTDLEDKGQTVEFPEHVIHTTAKDKETGTQEAIAKEQTTIVDTVSYQGLIVGQEYTVKGILMLKDTGEPLEIDGQQVTAEKTFAPEKSEGTVDLEFIFDSSELNNKEVVVFERLYTEGIEVAAHTDINDKGQTVKIRVGSLKVSMPDNKGDGLYTALKTGDLVSIFPYILLGLAAVGTIVTVVIIKRKKGKENER